MSYILDALKKSEREREAQASPHAASAEPQAVVAHAPLIALAVGILGAAAAGTWWGLASQPTDVTAPQPATAGIAEPVASPSPQTTGVAEPDAPPDAPVSAPATPTRDLAEQARKSTRPRQARAASAASAVGTPRADSSNEIPFLHALPTELRRGIPEMTVNIHVYAADEASRMLYINNRPALKGETIEGGVLVEDIVPDGVVLRFRGVRFKLPRPS
jgi:general secretion pathway protein B